MIYAVQSMDECLIHQWQGCESFAYRLHSRFSHAINWMDTDGELITFLSEGLPNGPNTLIVDIESFDDWALDESVMLTKFAQGLSLFNTNIELFIQDNVQLWQAELPKLSKVNNDAILAIHLFLSLHNGDLQEIEKKIYYKLDDNHQALCKAIDAKNYDEVIKSIQANIGLGLGLTPSGDDRLVGFLLGCFIQSPRNIDLLESIQKAVAMSQDRTNDISYAMLKHATAGRFNEWLVQLIHVIADGDMTALDDAIEDVFSIGSRSGGDMLKGLVLSLELFK
ncbi:MAG: DUF2877 domain-containing protein [Wohlfahrtiimonas sp.]